MEYSYTCAPTNIVPEYNMVMLVYAKTNILLHISFWGAFSKLKRPEFWKSALSNDDFNLIAISCN